MVLEVAHFEILAGQEDAFAAAYRGARHLLAEAGAHTVRMTRGIESPSAFTLLVEWDSVEAHDQGFRATDAFGTWRGAIGPHFAAPPLVEHFVDLA